MSSSYVLSSTLSSGGFTQKTGGEDSLFDSAVSEPSLVISGPLPDTGEESDKILYRLRLIQSTPGTVGVDHPYDGQTHPTGAALAFAINVLDQSGQPRLWEVTAFPAIPILPASEWSFVAASAAVETKPIKTANGLTKQSYITFRLFSAKVSDLSLDPHAETTLPEAGVTIPISRGVREISGFTESSSLTVASLASNDDRPSAPIMATSATGLSEIPASNWWLSVGRRVNPSFGTHIVSWADSRESYEGGFVKIQDNKPLGEDLLGYDPYHGWIHGLKICLGRGATLLEASRWASHRTPEPVELTAASSMQKMSSGFAVEALENGSFLEPSSPLGISGLPLDWTSSGTVQCYDQGLFKDFLGAKRFLRLWDMASENSWIESDVMEIPFGSVYRMQAFVRALVDETQVAVRVLLEDESQQWDPLTQEWVAFDDTAPAFGFGVTLPTQSMNFLHQSATNYGNTSLSWNALSIRPDGEELTQLETHAPGLLTYDVDFRENHGITPVLTGPYVRVKIQVRALSGVWDVLKVSFRKKVLPTSFFMKSSIPLSLASETQRLGSHTMRLSSPQSILITLQGGV